MKRKFWIYCQDCDTSSYDAWKTPDIFKECPSCNSKDENAVRAVVTHLPCPVCDRNMLVSNGIEEFPNSNTKVSRDTKVLRETWECHNCGAKICGEEFFYTTS